MKRLTLLFTCFIMSMMLAIAQNKQVSGTVTDENGEPVVGASVIVKGNATVGTVTDVDGRFSLSVPESVTKLVVKYLGMQEQEIKAEPKMNVTLSQLPNELKEVLVVAYGTSTKGTFTGSAGVLKAADLGKRQVSEVSGALAGAVAGVQILNSNGQPGTSSSIRIRGVGSINGSMAPLIVVDGIPYDGDLSSINTADVESVTVLKDAASTSLYGARGANGIVMVTTKKGASGKSKISVDARWGINSRSVTNYDMITSPKNYLETAYQSIYNAGIYNLGYNDVKANQYANQTLVSKTSGSGGLGYQIYTVPDGQLLIGMNGKLNPNATLGYSDGKYWYTPDDWAKETFQNNLRQEYNLTISGGNDNSHHYISIGYLKDLGVIPNSGFSRLSGRFNGDYKIKEWLKIGTNLNYNYNVSKYPSEQVTTNSSGNAFFIANEMGPIYPLYVRDAKTHQIIMNNGRKVYDYGDGVSTNFSRSFMSIANPLGDLTYNKEEYLMDVFNSSSFVELTPLKGLTLTARYGIFVDNTRYNSLGNAYMGQSAQYGGTAYQAHTRTSGFDQQYIADYRFMLHNAHQFDITAGFDGYSYTYSDLEGGGQNLYNPESFYLSNSIDNPTIVGYADFYATKGFFGRLNYSYNDKYFASLSFRRDASSRFAPNKRWGNFYSASAAWLINKEDFMKTVSWVDVLKVKASYGQQGNDNISSTNSRYAYYAWQDQFQVTGANGVFSDGTLLYKGNPDLTWETSNSYNAGIDFALFKNRLTGTVEYYGRKSSNMLYNQPVPGSIGYPYIPKNIGSMTNTGVEIDLTGQIVNTRNIKWAVNVNATSNKNKIIKLAPELGGKWINGTRIYEEGYSMYRMYLVKYAGVDPTTGQAQYWTKDDDGNIVKTFDYTDASAKNKGATKDLLPKWFGGFGTMVEGFGFDASIQFSYQLGGFIYDQGYADGMGGGARSTNGPSDAGQGWNKDIYNAWTPENTNTNVPRLNASDRYVNSQSDRFITNSNYLSLNNITVGYTVPAKLLREIQFDKIRVYFAADNIGIISSRKGLDPRQSFTSATTSLYTPIRTVSGGISITF